MAGAPRLAFRVLLVHGSLHRRFLFHVQTSAPLLDGRLLGDGSHATGSEIWVLELDVGEAVHL